MRFGSLRNTARAALLGLAALLALPSAGAATVTGDCNDNDQVTLGEVMTCAGIFLTRYPLSQCQPCDRNANRTVSIGEVIGSVHCYFDVNSPNCLDATPPPPTPTPTPTATEVPTATSTVPPTDTPEPTATPVPPTETPVPTETNTPEPTATPTETPVPTDTPVPTATPTETPTPEPTATATATETPTEVVVNDIKLAVTLRPAGGSAGNCRGTCVGGANAGLDCGTNANCPGSTCGGTKTCVGGPFNGASCSNAQQCTECRPNFLGAAPAGSCAIIQGKLIKVVVAPNGVCAPRTAPDVPCATDAECPSGKTCQLPGFEMTIAGEADEDGVRTVTVDPDSFSLPPAPVPIGGFTACITAGGEGVGFVDCNGGETGIDATLIQDHNTTPGNAGNSGGAVRGLPDDPNCDQPTTTAAGNPDWPCLEGSKTCSGGERDQQRCTTLDDCPGGTACSPCAQQDPPTQGHAGICNSGVEGNLSGTFDPGDLVVVMPLAILQLQNNEWGPDNLPCSPDDTPAEPPAAVPVTLSTGRNTVRIFDANNNATQTLEPGVKCGAPDCAAQVDGAPMSCSALDGNGNIAGTAFGGGFPALDIAVISDMVTTFNFVVGESTIVE